MSSLSMKGFTLVELMITIAILGVLASISYPIYTGYVSRAKRSEAEVALMSLASKLERYYTENNSYLGATFPKLGLKAETDSKAYRLAILGQTERAYTVVATPQGGQASDDAKCGSLLLNQLGIKSVTGSESVENCWQ